MLALHFSLLSSIITAGTVACTALRLRTVLGQGVLVGGSSSRTAKIIVALPGLLAVLEGRSALGGGTVAYEVLLLAVPSVQSHVALRLWLGALGFLISNSRGALAVEHFVGLVSVAHSTLRQTQVS